MTDWHTPQSALLIADSRSGGTMLAHALDCHPQIGFERGQMLHKRSRLLEAVADPDICGEILWARPGYHVSGFRVVYGEFDRLSDALLLRCAPRILWLTRDPLAMVVSRLLLRIAQAQEDTYARGLHLYAGDTPDELAPVGLDPQEVRQKVNICIAEDERIGARLKRLGLPVLALEYDTLTQSHKRGGLYGNGEICAFLGVDWDELNPNLQRVHPLPPERYVANWQVVLDALEVEQSCT